MYDPPTREYDGIHWEGWKEAYDKGYEAHRKGGSEGDNPYEPTNHERDSGHADELHYYWYSGFWAYEAGDPSLEEVNHEQLSALRLSEDDQYPPQA